MKAYNEMKIGSNISNVWLAMSSMAKISMKAKGHGWLKYAFGSWHRPMAAGRMRANAGISLCGRLSISHQWLSDYLWPGHVHNQWLAQRHLAETACNNKLMAQWRRNLSISAAENINNTYQWRGNESVAASANNQLI